MVALHKNRHNALHVRGVRDVRGFLHGGHIASSVLVEFRDDHVGILDVREECHGDHVEILGVHEGYFGDHSEIAIIHVGFHNDRGEDHGDHS